MRLIDLDYALVDVDRHGSYPNDYPDRWLEELPLVDAVPVIRCKDCRFRDQFGFCRRWLWQKAPNMEDEEYCSGAERIDKE